MATEEKTFKYVIMPEIQNKWMAGLALWWARHLLSCGTTRTGKSTDDIQHWQHVYNSVDDMLSHRHSKQLFYRHSSPSFASEGRCIVYYANNYNRPYSFSYTRIWTPNSWQAGIPLPPCFESCRSIEPSFFNFLILLPPFFQRHKIQILLTPFFSICRSHSPPLFLAN